MFAECYESVKGSANGSTQRLPVGLPMPERGYRYVLLSFDIAASEQRGFDPWWLAVASGGFGES
jgi:hypothetical protein